MVKLNFYSRFNDIKYNPTCSCLWIVPFRCKFEIIKRYINLLTNFAFRMLYTNPSVAAYDLGIYAQQAIDRYNSYLSHRIIDTFSQILKRKHIRLKPDFVFCLFLLK